MTTPAPEDATPLSRPVILGIAGCSGSGKTTLAEELAREWHGTHFSLDHYYRDLGSLTYEERCRRNFDDPSSLDAALLVEHVRALAAGKAIERPVYDFAKHTRTPGAHQHVQESRLLVVDGIFALYFAELRALYDLRVYVDAPDGLCYQRRLARDVRERGRTPEVVTDHYASTVRPMAEKYVRPSSKFADVVVDGTAAFDWSVEQVTAALATAGLLARLRSEAGSIR